MYLRDKHDFTRVFCGLLTLLSLLASIAVLPHAFRSSLYRGKVANGAEIDHEIERLMLIINDVYFSLTEKAL